MATNALPGARG